MPFPCKWSHGKYQPFVCLTYHYLTDGNQEINPPVSNLCFVSKLIELIVCFQLVDHLQENELYEIFRSAYRQLHSTETALLRVQNDILQAVDSEGGAIFLLDVNAAFDTTIDHQKLRDLLDYWFGIRWDDLKWLKSYLEDRTQTVQIGSGA